MLDNSRVDEKFTIRNISMTLLPKNPKWFGDSIKTCTVYVVKNAFRLKSKLSHKTVYLKDTIFAQKENVVLYGQLPLT